MFDYSNEYATIEEHNNIISKIQDIYGEDYMTVSEFAQAYDELLKQLRDY